MAPGCDGGDIIQSHIINDLESKIGFELGFDIRCKIV